MSFLKIDIKVELLHQVLISLKTLVEKAKLIPNTKLVKIKNIIGKNTQSAVRSGFCGVIRD